MPATPYRRAQYPPREEFRRVCEGGLALARPMAPGVAPDEWGWLHGQAWPPSYWAYGRMRALMAVHDALSLSPRRVLEIAAGDGSLSSCLADRGVEVVANDLRTEGLTQALKQYSPRRPVSVLGGNLFDLNPAATGLFDLVVACEVLEHVAHTVDFLKQLARFTRPGGHLLITTPNGRFFRNELPSYREVTDFAGLEAKQFKPDADGHLFLLTPGEMHELAAEAGLETVWLGVWGSPPLTGNAGMSRLSGKPLFGASWFAEQAIQRLPFALRAKLCTAMTCVLRPPAV